MTDQITWTEQVVALNALRPFESNPRTITEVQFAKLKASIVEDGLHTRPKVTHDLRLIAGHQRVKALKELGFTDIPVLVPSRPLSDDEFKRILIRDNHNNGLFDYDMLANMFDLEELRGFGLHEVGMIAPMDDGTQEEKPGKSMVCCPKCQNVFSVKGNRAKDAGDGWPSL
jgi:hypothetical protein